MNKKYYTFIILILLLLFLLYNIISHKHKEYTISKHINSISLLNTQIKENIKIAEEIIQYKKSKAYKNKVLKEDKWLKNKWEIVVYITTEDKYNKYISPITVDSETQKVEKIKSSETYWMTIYQKWIWYFFKKDLR